MGRKGAAFLTYRAGPVTDLLAGFVFHRLVARLGARGMGRGL